MTGRGMEPLLSVRGLTKKYGAMAAVSDLDFDVPAGSMFGISGPNGAGKTTLFDVITGVSRPTGGSIRLAGRELAGLSAEHICHLGVSRTFQLNAVFETMTVRDNLLCGAYFGARNIAVPGLVFDRASQRRADEVMEITGISSLAHERAGDLPVLQRKLLMLASAIASGPRLLLLDEPVGGLNPREIEVCAEIFRRLRHLHGITIVLIEHVMSFMTAIADRVMILHHGRKLHEGGVGSLAENPEVVAVYLGTAAAGMTPPAAEGG